MILSVIKVRKARNWNCFKESGKGILCNFDHLQSYEVISNQMKAKADVQKQPEQSTADADHLATQLPDTLQRAVNPTREKGFLSG